MFQAYKCRHGFFVHDGFDHVIGKSLSLYGEWAEEEIYLLSQIVSLGDTIVDVGANVGTHAVSFCRLVGDNGTVIAIDGHPVVSSLLAMNLLLNGLNNVLRIESLVGERNALMHDSRTKDAFTKVGDICFVDIEDRRAWKGFPRPVPLMTIDSLLLDACRLIKIDVEGMEYGVLKGARETIASKGTFVYFEQANMCNFIEIFEFFGELGYDLYEHISNPFNVGNFNGKHENIFGGAVEVNILAVPGGSDVGFIKGTILSKITNVNWTRCAPSRVQGWTLPKEAYKHLPPIGDVAVDFSLVPLRPRAD